MQLKDQYIVVVLITIIYSISILAIAFKIRNSKYKRRRILWDYIVLDGVLFLVGLSFLVFILPLKFLNLISFTIYDLIISYVLTIEIPGFLILVKYDETNVQNLNSLRACLIKMCYSFELFEDVKTMMKDNVDILTEEGVIDLIKDFVNICDRMKNLDKSIWELTVNEITRASDRIVQRSKHPFPKLIEILSLTGISFLLAQILTLID